ncbi:hypothetical protein TRICI_001869 [Trichomonascus ciferrii]|uniref:Auxin efflux carrier n=1 Tax=Trichomonascus ciferrii TaxID=44093 RepID=A0A642V793_9ASCO|nr:hypothetical protein TRICI_001869 [Trichomonascus ciferrii]
MEGNLDYFDLSFLTLQAVCKTILICVSGYVAARGKLLTANVQKQIGALNVHLFTPCLIFSKLASSLSLKALVDVAVIPVFFCLTTFITLVSGRVVSRIFKFNKAETNFVTAMAVFGNSNSVPVSLTVALAYTLPNLKWPDLPNDNSDDVASRGILYLLIFQQLGQILRWSWGYNTLLAKQPSTDHIHPEYSDSGSEDEESSPALLTENSGLLSNQHHAEAYDSQLLQNSSNNSSHKSLTHVASFERRSSYSSDETTGSDAKRHPLSLLKSAFDKFMAFMNVPLWSMFAAILVASIPPIKREFYESNGFIQNTLAAAITQLGSIAIPLVLVVLGANLAPSDEQLGPASKHHNKIIFASLFSRMILPSIFLLPITAFAVKYIKISILDDPIFLLVAFLLTASPPAIQLSQICQLNQVFEKEMAGVLFWGYAVLTLPSSLAIVISSLKVIEWSGTTVS